MTIDEFRKIDNEYRSLKPSLFKLSTPDPSATNAELDAVEIAIGKPLPKSYRIFLGVYGGGSYGLATVFSAHNNSEWYLPRQQAKAETWLPKGVIAFSDDFAGGNYVFQSAGQYLGEAVLYWSDNTGLMKTEFNDIFEFLVQYAFE